MCVQNKFVPLPVPEIIGGIQEMGSPWIRPRSFFSKIWNGFCSNVNVPVKFEVRSFTHEITAIEILGVANPQCWGREGRRGSWMVRFERALVSYCRPSIVTFQLSQRVSEILPLLCSSTPLFPRPISSLPKISPCSPGSRWMPFGRRRAKADYPCN